MTISESKSAADEPARILHITSLAEFERQRSGVGHNTGFVDTSLDGEGFIHCSTVEQFLGPANERFAGRSGLVLLVIEVSSLRSRVVYEDCYDSGRSYPHVYGPVEFEAIVGVVDFAPLPDGRFVEPPELGDHL